MRKSADVVILMQPNSNIELLYPKQVEWSRFEQSVPQVPFCDEVIEYLNALSVALMKDRRSRLYPDVVTFAFFCRKANLMRMRETYKTNDLRLGRGLVFHIAPSNVPVNFAYSLVAGMLAGNMNVVRASSKSFPQVDIIVDAMLSLFDSGQHGETASNFAVVRYARESEWNQYLSGIASVRVVWGGDHTIETLRQFPLPPRSFDVCFADRYSIAVINPTAVLSASKDELGKLAQNFYNDTYLFDQNACSAPHTIFWLKNTELLNEAKQRFWQAVHDLVAKKYNFQNVMAVDKLTAFYRQAVNMKCHAVAMEDNLVVRTQLEELPANIDEFRCAGGYFSEYDIDEIDEIAPVVSGKYQTLAYYGIETETLRDFVLRNHLLGLDRIVPIGETTAFSLTWDGYNLVETLSRIADII